ncbi:MAG: hypothetical protein WCI05_16775, partial [Myxococcales bacterium]
ADGLGLASFPQRNFSRKRAPKSFRKPNVSGAGPKASTVTQTGAARDLRGLSDNRTGKQGTLDALGVQKTQSTQTRHD